LTTAIPALAEWSLLYTTLRQLQPTITETPAGWLRRTTRVQLSVDLQPVATDWQQVALKLDAQAATLEAEAGARNTRDAAEAESALRARIQAANYRATAQEWRALIQNSRILVALTIPVGLQQPSRSWLLTPQSPTQPLELASAPSYVTALISVLVLSLGLLLLLSGLLWWLL
jgi:hypothetical protein